MEFNKYIAQSIVIPKTIILKYVLSHFFLPLKHIKLPSFTSSSSSSGNTARRDSLFEFYLKYMENNKELLNNNYYIERSIFLKERVLRNTIEQNSYASILDRFLYYFPPVPKVIPTPKPIGRHKFRKELIEYESKTKPNSLEFDKKNFILYSIYSDFSRYYFTILLDYLQDNRINNNNEPKSRLIALTTRQIPPSRRIDLYMQIEDITSKKPKSIIQLNSQFVSVKQIANMIQRSFVSVNRIANM